MGAIVGRDCCAVVGPTTARPFDSFWEPHFVAFCRTVCKLGPKRGTKMASKRSPLYNSLALRGPTRGSPQRGPRGEMRVPSVHPLPGGGAAVALGELLRRAREGPPRGEEPLLEDGVLRKMRAVQPLGSTWVESGSTWTERGRGWKGDGGEEPQKSWKRHTISGGRSIKSRQK